jgi:hypothetical protein
MKWHSTPYIFRRFFWCIIIQFEAVSPLFSDNQVKTKLAGLQDGSANLVGSWMGTNHL